MQDNNISFWKNLVRHFFEPGALKRWCLSNYNMSPIGQHAEGLFPMVCKIMSPILRGRIIFVHSLRDYKQKIPFRPQKMSTYCITSCAFKPP